MMRSLDHLLTKSSNGLTTIRLVAAFCVMVSHAWPLTLGKEPPEPLELSTGYSLGHWAVLVFFAISGFLVSASAARSRSLIAFARARARRIFPALAVMILLTSLLLGPLVTTLPPATYLRSPDLWRAILGNISLLDLRYTLPEVFTANPYPTVQGSIWTLPVEIKLYAIAALASALGALRSLPRLIIGLALYAALLPLADFQIFSWFYQPGIGFFLGMTLFALRANIPAHPAIILPLIALALALQNTGFFYPALALALGYSALTLALFLPAPRADYSYGLYLYAFPIQGLATFLFAPADPITALLLATPPTLLLAAASWHLIERPFSRK